MENKSTNYWMWIAIGAFALLILSLFFKITPNFGPANQQANISQASNSDLEKVVLPADGIVLPIKWGDLGKQMVDKGVIDAEQFEALYARRGGLDEGAKKMLYGENNSTLKMNMNNSGYILNLLWAFGLANKNPILEKGPMQDPQYGGAGRFASTGGWTLAKGNAMDHYSKYNFVPLNAEQQKKVERVSKGIFRPCCGNSAYFPDCNHGMAMLGLLELLAAQNADETEMYKVALQVNSYWFPDTYLTIAAYFKNKGIKWKDVDPKEVLGADYSSGRGFQQILSQVEPPKSSGGGGGCGV